MSFFGRFLVCLLVRPKSEVMRGFRAKEITPWRSNTGPACLSACSAKIHLAKTPLKILRVTLGVVNGVFRAKVCGLLPFKGGGIVCLLGLFIFFSGSVEKKVIVVAA